MLARHRRDRDRTPQHVRAPVLAGPVALGRGAEACRHRLADQVDQLVPRPREEPAFDALGVGVLRGEEPALGMLHLPQQVLDRLGRHAAIAILAGDLPGPRVQLHELGVVVEHLLEVGNVPRTVGGVPGEPPAHMVVDPALRHPVERDHHHLERVGHAAQRLPQTELQRHRLRELRCAPEPAPAPVERGPQGLHGRPGDLPGQRIARSFERPHAGDRFRDLAGLSHDLVATLIPCFGDARQHLAERRHPVSRLRRVVRARVERLVRRA